MMDVMAIFADGAGLMIGSLLVAAALTFAAWHLGEALGRRWLAWTVMLAVVAGMLVSPLEQSLFVRMLSVFAIAGAGLLWFVRSDAVPQDSGVHSRR